MKKSAMLSWSATCSTRIWLKTHVDAFRQARRDRPIGQAHGDLVIAKEEGVELGVAQVVQDGALDVGETSGSEEGGILSLLY